MKAEYPARLLLKANLLCDQQLAVLEHFRTILHVTKVIHIEVILVSTFEWIALSLRKAVNGMISNFSGRIVEYQLNFQIYSLNFR